MSDNKPRTNYVCGNAIFLCNSLNKDTCTEMYGDIAKMVNELRPVSNKMTLAEIQNPYNITSKSIIDIFIDSPGGDIYTMNTIMTFLNIARSKGAIIRTTVTGQAASCASMIAVQGTPGFRIMYNFSYHYIHYGNSNIGVSAIGEIDLAAQNEKELRQKQKDIYKQFTKLSVIETLQCMQSEHHIYSAEKCLEKNLCDWVLLNDGTFINRFNNQR